MKATLINNQLLHKNVLVKKAVFTTGLLPPNFSRDAYKVTIIFEISNLQKFYNEISQKYVSVMIYLESGSHRLSSLHTPVLSMLLATIPPGLADGQMRTDSLSYC